MAERTRRGRIGLFLLLPAMVAAVLVLGGFLLRALLQAEQLRQRAVIEATLTLANEKADRLERLIIEHDNLIVSAAEAAEPEQICRRWLQTAARETPNVRALLLLDMNTPERQVLAFASRSPGPDDEAFRRLLVHRILGELELDRPPIEELRHLHRPYERQSYLLSYWQINRAGRRYLIVAWHDVGRLVHEVFPRLFADPSGHSRLNVVDEQGLQVFGAALRPGEFTVGKPFPTTLYGWQLQVSLTATDELGQQVERGRLLEIGLVITACVVIILGLSFVFFAVEKERRLSEQKSEFVANVSHELKTPLSLVRLFSELLMTNRVQSEEKRQQYLQIMVLESERLSGLIENVLDFARVERGKATFDFAPGDLGEVVQRAVDVYRYRAEREGVEIDAQTPRNLPEVRVDARAMELALINLLDNALKYAKGGKRIEVRVSRKRRALEVSVQDAGPGIPREERRRIFDRFVRGQTARDAGVRGTGIGLSLVKHIAEAHGGYVQVHSEPGQGAMFVIGIPFARAAATASDALEIDLDPPSHPVIPPGKGEP
jgi:two-component system, OmpR family, phosphate regulon sensor histidine kinase PhoR